MIIITIGKKQAVILNGIGIKRLKVHFFIKIYMLEKVIILKKITYS